MLIVNIIGGLGNQMFQYAAARALALEKGTSCSLDVSDFANYKLHQGFELQRVFGCSLPSASSAEVWAILGWQSSPLMRRLLAKPAMSAFRRRGLVIEPHFNYWQGLKEVPEDSYLIGYWQSERYFRDVAQTIRDDFTFRNPMSALNAGLAEQIRQVNAVSLHVRRGDYVKNPKTTATHGLCSLEYYRSAIRHVAERVERPNFFVFSDDAPWVRENLATNHPCVYVDHNQGAQSYNDMRLMSMCKHHIIANSSFSWWGAWLNPSDAKIVVAPKQWFANGNDASDLIPPEWIKL